MIYKQPVSTLYRLCQQENETVTRLVGGCKKLLKTKINDRHNNVARYIHWCLLQDRKYPVPPQWEDHNPPKTMLSDNNTTLIWDKIILTDMPVEANQPDIVLIKEEVSRAYLIDISVLLDASIVSMNAEKHTKYCDLEIICKKNHKLCRVHTIPVVVGAFGTMCRNLDTYITKISPSIKIDTIQKTALLGSAHIL
eukprot:7852797-Ditylum_brightwellii.AAC.1